MQDNKFKNYSFKVEDYKSQLLDLLSRINSEKKVNALKLRQILRIHPKDGRGIFSKEELVAGYRYFVKQGILQNSQTLLDKLKMKPSRTISGVVPVTVLTKPFPCPGKCIFCPTDVRMPKSYLSSEPGAQRAERNLFDPYLQTYNRLLAFGNIGHSTTKVELIVLGGTWSAYPLFYRIWFIKRCFEAMNDFGIRDNRANRELERRCDWEELEREQEKNETAIARNVGLVLETRPDYINPQEVINLRRLGATKVQIGIQSMDDSILLVNKRGHTVEQTLQAIDLLRNSGFKIHAHWMPNLYKASVAKDKKDYLKIWQSAQPDELKIYPTSIIKGTELFDLFEMHKYQPYNYDQLVDVLKFCFLHTPRFVRLTRVIRDIPAGDIVAGNKLSNLRQIVESDLLKTGQKCQCIRCREIRNHKVTAVDLEIEQIQYTTRVSQEYFLSYKTKVADKLAGFLRLSLPTQSNEIFTELVNSAIIREVHVYGQVVDLGIRDQGRAQHLGLGTKLVQEAVKLAREAGFKKITVISAIGTREYYKKLGFNKDGLYMSMAL